jgi:hypothetical protein
MGLGSILDVGCGRHGLACARPGLPFVGLEVAFDAPPAPNTARLCLDARMEG